MTAKILKYRKSPKGGETAYRVITNIVKYKSYLKGNNKGKGAFWEDGEIVRYRNNP